MCSIMENSQKEDIRTHDICEIFEAIIHKTVESHKWFEKVYSSERLYKFYTEINQNNKGAKLQEIPEERLRETTE